MTAYEDLSAVELRDQREEWHRRVCELAREYRTARQSGIFAWEAGVGVALDQALAQVRRIEKLLQLGVAA